jgi:two-component sensor histidine kinase
LQSSATRDQATIALLDDSRNRIQSMALVHELLYRSSNLAAIDLADYVSALASHLVRSQTTTARIDLVTSLEPVALAVDTAIPCGLILNEMLTNAMKHAFQGRPEGRLEIELRRAGADCVMQVSDDGIGIPEAVDPADAGTLGLRVMRSLTRQLDGTLEIVRGNPGTSARLTFRP